MNNHINYVKPLHPLLFAAKYTPDATIRASPHQNMFGAYIFTSLKDITNKTTPISKITTAILSPIDVVSPIAHSSRCFSYSSKSRSMTSRRVSTRNSYLRSQSLSYSSFETLTIGYFCCFPGINKDNGVYNINNSDDLVSLVSRDNKIYIGGCY